MSLFQSDLSEQLRDRDKHPKHPPYESQHRVIKGSIEEIAAKIQSPTTLIISSMLSVLSIACQARRSVIHPSGQTSPLSLYFFTLAASGDRKTSTDGILMEPVREFQKAYDKKFRKSVHEYNIEMDFWNQEKKAIDKKIDRSLRDDKTENLEILKLEKKRILNKKPQEPTGLKLQIDNITSAAFLRFFDKYQPTTSIISDEGASALTSFASANVGNLNNSWNGKSLSVERTSSDSFTVENPRLTVHLMLQPEIFKRALGKENNIWQESGLLARSLFSFPPSMIGNRKPTPKYERAYWEFDDFKRKITKLLEQSYASPTSEQFPPMRFSADAEEIWNDYSLRIEHFMLPGGPLSSITAMASKISENIARVAALLQCFESVDEAVTPKISAINVKRAIDLCHWYLVEYNLYFGNDGISPVEKNADLLLLWLNKKATWNSPAYAVPKQLIAKNATPHSLRYSNVWQPALDHLEKVGKVRLEYAADLKEEWVLLTAPPTV